jgi:hypothetical protein
MPEQPENPWDTPEGRAYDIGRRHGSDDTFADPNGPARSYTATDLVRDVGSDSEGVRAAYGYGYNAGINAAKARWLDLAVQRGAIEIETYWKGERE